MPTYHVTGVHLDTGEPVEKTFRAKNDTDAKAYCNQQRIGIESLEPAGPNASSDARPDAAPPSSITASADVLTELRGLRAEIRTQNQLLDKTLNERTSPFFKHLESRTRMAVGCGIIVGIILLAVLSVIMSIVLPGLIGGIAAASGN